MASGRHGTKNPKEKRERTAGDARRTKKKIAAGTLQGIARKNNLVHQPRRPDPESLKKDRILARNDYCNKRRSPTHQPRIVADNCAKLLQTNIESQFCFLQVHICYSTRVEHSTSWSHHTKRANNPSKFAPRIIKAHAARRRMHREAFWRCGARRSRINHKQLY